jgi:hypothetical protein
VLRGLVLLLLGSALLLLPKMPVPEAIGGLSALTGGIALLCGNGCVIYGLLIFADARAS